MKIGHTFKRLRKAAGQSQEKVAAQVGISRVYLSELERDLKSPTLDVFVRIARTFGMTATQLMAAIENDRR